MDAANTNPQSLQPDHYDEPYRFGRRPTARAPYPFTELQFARLLILKGRLADSPSREDLLAA